MTTLTTSPPTIDTLADLLERLGGIGPERIRFRPPPGRATEEDVLDVRRREGRICELVDGALVEKAMGYGESVLAGAILAWLRAFVIPRNQGLVSGADGMMRLFPGLVRIPNVAFASWARVPGGRFPAVPVPDIIPDLAVEVLSEGNTAGEMARKCREYFESGVRLAWLVDPKTRTVAVYTAPDRSIVLGEAQVLDGGDILPGFQLRLAELFAELDRDENS